MFMFLDFSEKAHILYHLNFYIIIKPFISNLKIYLYDKQFF